MRTYIPMKQMTPWKQPDAVEKGIAAEQPLIGAPVIPRAAICAIITAPAAH